MLLRWLSDYVLYPSFVTRIVSPVLRNASYCKKIHSRYIQTCIRICIDCRRPSCIRRWRRTVVRRTLSRTESFLLTGLGMSFVASASLKRRNTFARKTVAFVSRPASASVFGAEVHFADCVHVAETSQILLARIRHWKEAELFKVQSSHSSGRNVNFYPSTGRSSISSERSYK